MQWAYLLGVNVFFFNLLFSVDVVSFCGVKIGVCLDGPLKTR